VHCILVNGLVYDRVSSLLVDDHIFLYNKTEPEPD